MEISQRALALLYWYALLLGVGLGAFYDALRITRVFLGVHYNAGAAKRLGAVSLPILGTRGRRRESRFLGVVIFLEDLMFAAGLSRPEVAPGAKQAEETVYDRFRSLPAKDRRTVEEFIEFLYARSHQEQESHQDNQ